MRIKNCTLYLIRHGQSIRNLQPHLIGQAPDEPLSDLGERQAKALGEYFQDHLMRFDTICTSPYKRAMDTCLIACEQFGGEVSMVAPELREYSAGQMMDANRNEVITPEVKAEMLSKGMAFKWSGGESLYEVEQRAAGWLERTLQTAKDGEIVACFSHGMTLKCLLHYIMKFTHRLTWRIKLDNTSVSKLEMRDGEWHIHSLNDTRHLEYV